MPIKNNKRITITIKIFIIMSRRLHVQSVVCKYADTNFEGNYTFVDCVEELLNDNCDSTWVNEEGSHIEVNREELCNLLELVTSGQLDSVINRYAKNTDYITRDYVIGFLKEAIDKSDQSWADVEIDIF